MSLASLPTLLVVPPLNCLAAACIGAVWYRRRTGRVLLALGLSGLVLLSVPLVSGTLLASLEGGLPTQIPAGTSPGAIVILSADEQEVEQDGVNGFAVGHLTLARERAGAVLARRTGLPILVSGGQIRAGSPALATLMAASLQQDFGLPTMWQEDKSQDTWQNAALSTARLHAAGIGQVYLVTSAWHMRRALIAFRAAGLKTIAVSADQTKLPRLQWDMIVPHVSAWEDSYYALHEWIGCAWYALHAWRA